MLHLNTAKSRLRYRLPTLLLTLLIAACAPTPTATPTPSPTRTAAPRSTLPPTWTPTDSPTPAPPTRTPSPTTPPTLTPTPDDTARCAAFAPFTGPPDGAALNRREHHTFSFIWEYPLPGESVSLRITHVGSGQTRLLTVPGPDSVVVTLPFRVLYGPGVYAWSLAPDDADGQPLPDCAQTGRFTLLAVPREARFWPVPLP